MSNKKTDEYVTDESVELPVKRTTGDTLKDRMTDNAYKRILPARYLRQDENGEMVESQEELFERVAKNVALAEAVYAAEREGEAVLVEPSDVKPNHSNRDELVEEVFDEGVALEEDVKTELTESNVSKFAYDTVVPKLDGAVRDAVEETREEFQEAMERLSFIPNSPTLMNAGDELQQLSACFVDSPADDMQDIHETAKEAAEVFQCLTEDARVRVEGEGVVSVADVEPGDSIVQRDGDGHTTRKVEEVHAYDDAPVRRLVTEAGIEITGTPNHELLIDGEWTRIDETEAGDSLALRLGWLGEKDAEVELETVETGALWGENRTVSNDDIRELHSEGLSDYEIAEVLDTSSSTVQRRRSIELGLDPNGSGGRAEGDVSFDTDGFERLHEDGCTDGEIADELGVSTRAVVRYREQRSLGPNGRAVKTVTQPKNLTPELAELVGLWVGDGSVHEDGIRFHLVREETLEHADRLCRELFDEGLDWRWEDGCYDAVLHSHEVKRWWLANFGDAKPDAPNARVPDAVKRAGRETVAAFLRGLFSTDGGLQKNLYPRLWSSSEELIDGVQQLLLGVGVPAARWEYDTDERDYYNVGPTGELALEKFAEHVGFVDSRLETMRDEFDSVDSEGPAVGRIEGSTWHLPVESVEEAGTDTVYDVTVAEEPEYVANSVVSHNSGGGMGYAFWKLRPYGDPVGSTGGIASGPITFMRTFDQMCFVPGTKILTPDGNVPIEEIEEGDAVIDENGDLQPVTATMERGVEEEIVEITPERVNKPLSVTREHPFKVAREDDFEWVDAGDLREGDRLVLGNADYENDFKLDETVSLPEISSGALVFTDGGVRVNSDYYGASKGRTPAAFADEVPVSDFATVAGWYLAEGCVVYRRGVPNEVIFTLNSDEYDAVDEIRSSLASFGIEGRVERVEERNTVHVHAENASFAEFVEGVFGTGAAEKTVPDILWNAPTETQARVLEALFDGDGRLEKRGDSQRAKLKLTNEEIVDFVFQAGLRCGVQFSRHHREPKGKKPTYSVSASVSTALGTPLERLFDQVPEGFCARDRTKQAHGREVVEVSSVETVEYEGPVYNAEVADTHTYVAEDLVVHNCETIAQGGTRRGAQMGVMRVSHPDVIQFIHAKNKDVSLAHSLRLNDPDDYTHTSFLEALKEARELIDDEGRVPKHLRNAAEGHLSNFNISVGVSHEFMEALENDEEFTFTNPRTGEPHVATQETKELYDRFDLGEYVEVGEELSVPADEIWTRMVEGAYENGEPGVIYLDRVNDEHSFDVEEYSEHEILATNPCGEQPLEEYEACNLGHINLSTLVAQDAPDWRDWYAANADDYTTLEDAVDAFLNEAIDWDEFDRRIDVGTRFLENVVTMSDFPIDEIEEKVAEMRKIGLGIMGLAQMYVQVGIRYGSDEANEVARQVMTHINHESKRTSHELARERGVFDEWDKSKYADPTGYREWFEKQTGESADDWDEGYPVRNHNTTTIAPTGTTSMLGNTTGGCEPIYNVAYYKNVSDDVQGDEMLVEFDDYFLRVLRENDIDVDSVKEEAKEQMSANEFDGVDGLETVPDAIGELFVTTGDLSAKEHASVQCACQEGVDSAISKTTNAPHDSTVEDAKEVFEFIYENGGKGVTYYRDGTRSKQVLTTRADNKEAADDTDPVDEVREMLAEGEISVDELTEGVTGVDASDADTAEVEASASGDEANGVSETTPVETDGATGTPNRDDEFAPRPRPDTITGATQKVETGYGGLYVTINEDDEGMFEVFARIGKSGGYTASFTEAIARLTSLCLRSGIPPEQVVEQLEGIRSPKVTFDRGEQVHSVPDAMAKAMTRYMKGETRPQQARLPLTEEEDGSNGEVEKEVESDGGVATADTTSTATQEPGTEAGGSDVQQIIDEGRNPECPDCGSMLVYTEGCVKCNDCGFSEC